MTTNLIAIEESHTAEAFEQSDNDNNNNDEKSNGPIVLKRQHTVMITQENNGQMRWFEDYYKVLEPLGEPGTFGMAFKCFKKTDKSCTYFAVKQINK
eukprot:283218_1